VELKTKIMPQIVLIAELLCRRFALKVDLRLVEGIGKKILKEGQRSLVEELKNLENGWRTSVFGFPMEELLSV